LHLNNLLFNNCEIILLVHKNCQLLKLKTSMMNIFAVLYKISFINMNNFDELNKSKYAQMQSSIFNKAGSSIVSSSSGFGTPSKLNLTGKFAGIEETVRSVENDSHILTQAARVSLFSFRNLVGQSNK